MIRPGTLTVGWAVALSAVGALAVLAVIPPALGGDAGAMLHHAFAAVCHQMPERSLHLHGGPIAASGGRRGPLQSSCAAGRSASEPNTSSHAHASRGGTV